MAVVHGVAFHTVTYALLDIEDAATLYVAGEPSASHVVYLCPGFPCNHSSMLPLAARLAKCGCLVGVGCLPEFDREVPLRTQGYGLEEMLTCFEQGVATLKAQGVQGTPLSIIVHDWAVVFGFIYSNKIGCQKLIAIDVLPPHQPESAYTKYVHKIYQTLSVLSFQLYLKCGHAAARCFQVGWYVIIYGIFKRWLLPSDPKTDGRWCVWANLTSTPDAEMAGSAVGTPYRMYPYYYVSKLASDRPMAMRLAPLYSFHASLAKQPICYLYGTTKNTNWHSKSQLSQLHSTSGCEVHPLTGGHWCHKHDPDVCFEAIKAFIMK